MRRILQQYPTCSGIVALLVVLHFLLNIFKDGDGRAFSLRPRKVIKDLEVYRIVTNAFFHSSNTHLGINLLGLYGVGKEMESALKSPFQMARLVLFSVVFISLLYVGIAYFLCFSIFHNDAVGDEWIRLGCKGFSGVIFHLTVLSCYANCSSVQSLDFFEGIDIPAQYFPWASLIMWHLFDAENERGTLLHLCGILIGYVHVWGYLRPIFPDICEAYAMEDQRPAPQRTDDEVIPTREITPPKILDKAELRGARLRRFQ